MSSDDERRLALAAAIKLAHLIADLTPREAKPTHVDRPAPTPPPGSGPAPVGCPADILRVLRETGHRLTSDGVMAALAVRGLEHADGKVKAALSTMVDLGILTNCQDCNPRGYGFPDWPKTLEK